MLHLILIVAALAAVGYFIYKNLPEAQDVYDEAAKEENLIATDVTDVVEKAKEI